MKKPNNCVRKGLSLRKARQMWHRAGGTVAPKHGTGEDIYQHPRLARPINVGALGRAKDAPRRLILALRHVLEQ